MYGVSHRVVVDGRVRNGAESGRSQEKRNHVEIGDVEVAARHCASSRLVGLTTGARLEFVDDDEIEGCGVGQDSSPPWLFIVIDPASGLA